MDQIQPIEGITPDALWTTVQVLLGLAAIALVVFKIVEFWWKAKDRKQAQQRAARLTEGNGVTDEIADKVLAKLAPRLDKIESKLENDKQRLDSHELRLNENERNLVRISKDTGQILDVLDGLLMHFISGNDHDKLRDVKANLDHYKNGR